MNILTKLIFCTPLLFAFHGALACDYPSRVKVANGATASKEDMIQSQKDVKNFVAAMETYLECIVEEEKIALSSIEDIDADVEQQREEMLTKKYNAAVEQMETVAADFNAEVQDYKARDES